MCVFLWPKVFIVAILIGSVALFATETTSRDLKQTLESKNLEGYLVNAVVLCRTMS